MICGTKPVEHEHAITFTMVCGSAAADRPSYFLCLGGSQSPFNIFLIQERCNAPFAVF